MSVIPDLPFQLLVVICGKSYNHLPLHFLFPLMIFFLLSRYFPYTCPNLKVESVNTKEDVMEKVKGNGNHPQQTGHYARFISKKFIDFGMTRKKSKMMYKQKLVYKIRINIFFLRSLNGLKVGKRD